MIPIKLGETLWRRETFDDQFNDYNLRAELYLVHEVREEAKVREEATRLRAARRYNTQVRERKF